MCVCCVCCVYPCACVSVLISLSHLLLTNVHKLKLEVTNALLVGALEHERKGIPLILRLHGDNVTVVRALEDLAEVDGVEAEGGVAVAAVVVEAVGAKGDGAEGHVGGVHGLDGETVGGAVDVGVGDELG